MFKELQTMIDDVNASNSTNDKLEALGKYPELEKIIRYTYNPLKQFYVTSKTISKHPEASDEWKGCKEEDIFELLDKLNKREITGHAALASVKGFIAEFPEHEELIYRIIDRNLKTRVNATGINKVFKGLIPEFKVQLAEKFDVEKVPFFEGSDIWFSSRKLDGVRCLAICQDGKVKLFSRTGKEFLTLDKVAEAIETEIKKDVDFVLDGEICIVDSNGNENFTDVMKQIRKKDYTIENPRYKIFDILSLEDFLAKKTKETFSDRYEDYMEITSPSGILDPVEQTPIKDVAHFEEMSAYADTHGWEGLIIRKDVPYAGKRSKDMLKVKSFHDAEYKVLSIVNGPFRIISEDTGLEVQEEMMASVVIEHKGNKVNVGSGFSIKERRQFFTNPKDIVGKKITVKYFEESEDKDGNLSLRFPTLKAIHGVEREL